MPLGEDREYQFQEALRISGLAEARFRYLEKEFGRYIGIDNTFFAPCLYNGRQISVLRKIESLLEAGGLPLEEVKDTLRRYVVTRKEGIWIAAVTSGKGGVGKTSMAVNLSIAMARMGVKPTVVDGDLGMANAHLLMGLLPSRSLDDVVRGDAGMEDIIMKSRYGVNLVPGGSGVASLAELARGDREALMEEIRKLTYHTDTLVIDTGSGISANVTRFLSLADDIIVVATPNIASCVDALGLIGVVANNGNPARINVLVNRCRTANEGEEVFSRLSTAVKRLTGMAPLHLGTVPEDWRLEAAFQRGMPVTSFSAPCRSSRQIRQVARKLLSERRRAPVEKRANILRLFRDAPGNA